MSYVREVLQPGEVIRFRTNVHWLVYLPAMMMFVVGLAFALWYTAAPSHHLMLVILSGLSAVAGVLLFIPAWLKRFGTEIAKIHGALPEVAAAQWSGGTRYVFKLPILNGRRPSRSAGVTVDEVFVM